MHGHEFNDDDGGGDGGGDCDDNGDDGDDGDDGNDDDDDANNDDDADEPTTSYDIDLLGGRHRLVARLRLDPLWLSLAGAVRVPRAAP